MVKKHSSKQGWFSKLANVLVWAIATIGVWKPFVTRGIAGFDDVIGNATFGLVSTAGGVFGVGSFDLNKGLAMYAPVPAAIAIGRTFQYLRRHFPVR